jgi:hypothetical protein
VVQAFSSSIVPVMVADTTFQRRRGVDVQYLGPSRPTVGCPCVPYWAAKYRPSVTCDCEARRRDTPQIELAEAIRQLRSELATAMQERADQDPPGAGVAAATRSAGPWLERAGRSGIDVTAEQSVAEASIMRLEFRLERISHTSRAGYK